MKTSELKKRLQKDRQMTTISLRMPEDVIEELKRIAPKLGFSGYQPLIKAYVGQGLRVDSERFDSQTANVVQLVENLKRLGVAEDVIESALAETQKAA